MVEPFTTWAMVSTILNILFTTTTTLVAKKDQIVGFKRNLDVSISSFEACRSRYIQWLAVLGWNTPKRQEELATILKKEDFDQIKSRVEKVGIHAKLVLKRLSLDDEQTDGSIAAVIAKISKPYKNRSWGPSFKHPAESAETTQADGSGDMEIGLDGFTKVWRDNIRSSGGDIARLKAPKHGILRRVRWVLWREDQLNKCFGLMKTYVDDLIKFGDDVFTRKGFSPGITDLLVEQRRLIENAKFISDGLANHQTDDRWELTLTFPGGDLSKPIFVPSELGCSVYRSKTNCFQKVQVEEGEPEEADPTVVMNMVKVQRTLFESDILEAFFHNRVWMSRITRDPQPITVWTPSLRTLLHNCTDNDALAMDLFLERTKIAYALASWASLLEATPMFDNLCSCGIRGLVLQESIADECLRELLAKKQHGDTGYLEYTFRPHYYGTGPEGSERCPNHPAFNTNSHFTATPQGEHSRVQVEESHRQKVSRGRLYALAIILAELVLGQVVDNRQVDPSGKLCPGSDAKLLDSIASTGPSRFDMKSVIKYCLKEATKAQGLHTDRAEDSQSWGQRKEFSRRVVRPLQTFCEVIAGYFKDNAGLTIVGRLKQHNVLDGKLDQTKEHAGREVENHIRPAAQDETAGFVRLYSITGHDQLTQDICLFYRTYHQNRVEEG